MAYFSSDAVLRGVSGTIDELVDVFEERKAKEEEVEKMTATYQAAIQSGINSREALMLVLNPDAAVVHAQIKETEARTKDLEADTSYKKRVEDMRVEAVGLANQLASGEKKLQDISVEQARGYYERLKALQYVSPDTWASNKAAFERLEAELKNRTEIVEKQEAGEDRRQTARDLAEGGRLNLELGSRERIAGKQTSSAERIAGGRSEAAIAKAYMDQWNELSLMHRDWDDKKIASEVQKRVSFAFNTENIARAMSPEEMPAPKVGLPTMTDQAPVPDSTAAGGMPPTQTTPTPTPAPSATPSATGGGSEENGPLASPGAGEDPQVMAWVEKVITKLQAAGVGDPSDTDRATRVAMVEKIPMELREDVMALLGW